MTRNPLILDTDGGVDDAQALLMLLAHGIRPMGITTVFGNVAVGAATRNILDVLSLAKAEVPVHMGQSGPLTGAAIHAQEIHGEDGLGAAPRPAQTGEASGRDAVEFLVSTLVEAVTTGTKIDLLMIGPLTNLALALRLAPVIASGIGQLTIMGGTLYGRGNVTPAAEFNIYADPEAAAIVFAADIPTVVVAWEVCLAHAMPSSVIDALIGGLPKTPLAQFSAHLMLHARQVSFRHGGDGHFRFVDPLAAAVVIDPGLVTAQQSARVDVALAPGLTRGMTVIDSGGRLGTPPVGFVEKAEIIKLKALFKASAHWSP